MCTAKSIPRRRKLRLRRHWPPLTKESNFHGAALEARHRCPALLTREFQLPFLRAEVFDVVAAVKRYNKYWTQRVEMFGPERAFGPLTIEADEEDALMADVLELLPVRHSTGSGDSCLSVWQSQPRTV